MWHIMLIVIGEKEEEREVEEEKKHWKHIKMLIDINPFSYCVFKSEYSTK